MWYGTYMAILIWTFVKLSLGLNITKRYAVDAETRHHPCSIHSVSKVSQWNRCRSLSLSHTDAIQTRGAMTSPAQETPKFSGQKGRALVYHSLISYHLHYFPLTQPTHQTQNKILPHSKSDCYINWLLQTPSIRNVHWLGKPTSQRTPHSLLHSFHRQVDDMT